MSPIQVSCEGQNTQHCNASQTIKTWYKYAPDILGKKLAARKKLGGVIPQEQREVGNPWAFVPSTQITPTCFLLEAGVTCVIAPIGMHGRHKDSTVGSSICLAHTFNSHWSSRSGYCLAGLHGTDDRRNQNITFGEATAYALLSLLSALMSYHRVSCLYIFLAEECSMAVQKNELETEEKYLRQEGFSEEKVEKFVAQDKDPIITGVY